MKIAIIGCGGHARSVADIILDNNSKAELTFFDEMANSGETIMGGCYVCSPDSFKMNEYDEVVLAIGDNKKRSKWIDKLNLSDYKCANVVSNCAYVSERANVGNGTVVLDSAHIGPEASIGNYSIINTSAVVEHECKVGDFSHISVNTAVCGRSQVGDYCFIGAGATIIDKIKICNNVIIGAGATVVSDINHSGVYVGTPARKVKDIT